MTTPVSLARAFAFFEDPHNLAVITPAWLNFRIVNPGTVAMRSGAEIDYIIRWLGLPLKWKTRITEYEPPNRFVDEQIRGPYSLWRHTHTFRETNTGTVIADRVDYRLPLGLAGAVAHALVIRNQLFGIFRFRQQAIAGILVPDNPGSIATTEPAITRL